MITFFYQETGFITDFAASGSSVSTDGLPLVTTKSKNLATQRHLLSAQHKPVKLPNLLVYKHTIKYLYKAEDEIDDA